MTKVPSSRARASARYWARTVQIGDRVNITAGDERGGWGIVHNIRDASSTLPTEYHVQMFADPRDVRVFERHEISKPRQEQEAGS